MKKASARSCGKPSTKRIRGTELHTSFVDDALGICQCTSSNEYHTTSTKFAAPISQFLPELCCPSAIHTAIATTCTYIFANGTISSVHHTVSYASNVASSRKCRKQPFDATTECERGADSELHMNGNRIPCSPEFTLQWVFFWQLSVQIRVFSKHTRIPCSPELAL